MTWDPFGDIICAITGAAEAVSNVPIVKDVVKGFEPVTKEISTTLETAQDVSWVVAYKGLSTLAPGLGEFYPGKAKVISKRIGGVPYVKPKGPVAFNAKGAVIYTPKTGFITGGIPYVRPKGPFAFNAKGPVTYTPKTGFITVGDAKPPDVPKGWAKETLSTWMETRPEAYRQKYVGVEDLVSIKYDAAGNFVGFDTMVADRVIERDSNSWNPQTDAGKQLAASKLRSGFSGRSTINRIHMAILNKETEKIQNIRQGWASVGDCRRAEQEAIKKSQQFIEAYKHNLGGGKPKDIDSMVSEFMGVESVKPLETFRRIKEDYKTVLSQAVNEGEYEGPTELVAALAATSLSPEEETEFVKRTGVSSGYAKQMALDDLVRELR